MDFLHAKRIDRLAQRALALWAAECAGHVLGLFEAQLLHDDRPRKAIEGVSRVSA